MASDMENIKSAIQYFEKRLKEGEIKYLRYEERQGIHIALKALKTQLIREENINIMLGRKE